MKPPTWLSTAAITILQGTFHISLGPRCDGMADANNLEAYLDRALIEYAAASFHFEQAGTSVISRTSRIIWEFSCSRLDAIEEAHSHLDRARQLYSELKDTDSVAQVDETRARTFSWPRAS